MSPADGANGMSDIEGKVAREAMSECGQGASFKNLYRQLLAAVVAAAMTAADQLSTLNYLQSLGCILRFPGFLGS